MTICSKQLTGKNIRVERRKKQRVTCSESTFFSTGKEIQEILIKDIGDNGIFVESDMAVTVGQIITIAVPSSENKGSKYRGKIAWSKQGGFGVHLY